MMALGADLMQSALPLQPKLRGSPVSITRMSRLLSKD
jgi:hypothetical protein